MLIAYSVGSAIAGARFWCVQVEGYQLKVEDRQGCDIVTFHWHPVRTSPIRFPHVHMGAQRGELNFSKAHIPTGIISLPQVVRFAIEELGVEPLRDDWREVLAPV